jgi:allantoin racemase
MTYDLVNLDPPLRLLCINPNTTGEMTEKVVAMLASRFPAGTVIAPVTSTCGPAAVVDRITFALGENAALRAFAARGHEPWDAVLLACFGDPALLAMRDIADVPVLAMADSALTLADRAGKAFAIVTGGVAWENMLKAFAALVRRDAHLVCVKTIAAHGGEIFADPAGARAALLAAIRACVAAGAEEVILGGAGLAGLAQGLGPQAGVPLRDGVEALATLTLETVLANRAAGLLPRASPRASRMHVNGWL